MNQTRKPAKLKDIEIELISELMKNSRVSDRELARKLNVSQPTVSRVRQRLEKKGIIRDYTMLPDLTRVGYEIMALTFVRLKHVLSDEEIEGAKNVIKETLRAMPLDVIMLERGMGMDYDGVIISNHMSYTAYSEFLELLRRTGFIDVEQMGRFLVDLKDKVRFLPLNFSLLAQSIAARTIKERKAKAEKKE